jgi:aldose 1-epimerase
MEDRNAKGDDMTITTSDFGRLPDGTPAELYTLTNRHGLIATITPYGAHWVSLLAPDRQGRLADVVLGFDSVDGYVTMNPIMGAVVGRVANRVDTAVVRLDGVAYQLTPNREGYHMHGGARGFDKVMWTAQPGTAAQDTPCLCLTYLSKDGEEGYPGNLQVSVVYTLTADDALTIAYDAVGDSDTFVNLTNHAYFNLAGVGMGDVLDHVLRLDAAFFTPINDRRMPTGEIRPVAGTPLDFRTPQRLGSRIAGGDEQIQLARGYDHNYVLSQTAGAGSCVADVYDPSSGRAMELYTSEPGVQLYTGNMLNGSAIGKGGHAYGPYAGFCLETQHFPDAPNHAAFPSIVLRAGKHYRQITSYRFVHRP